MIVEPHDDMKTLGGSASYEMTQTKCDLLHSNLSILYLNKYGLPISKKNVLNNKDDVFWIDGNRQIEISLADGFVNIFYTDLDILNKIIEEKKIKTGKQEIGTKADI